MVLSFDTLKNYYQQFPCGFFQGVASGLKKLFSKVLISNYHVVTFQGVA
jgi:hypothetical protein